MAVLGFVLRRIRAAPGRWLPGALGIGAAFAGFVVALIAPAMAGDVALRSELRNLPVADRLVTLVAIARQPVGDTAVDPFVRAQLRRRGFDDPVRLTMLRQLAAPAGTVFRLAGVDQLGGGVELIDGRLPTHCDVDDCEAVIWARDTAPTSITLDPALHLHVVGTVRRVDDRVMAGTFEPHPHEVVILVDGADSPDRITALELIQRSTGWVTAVDPDHLAVDDIPGVLGNLAGLGRSNEVANLAVTGPDAALRSIYDRARITTNRLALPVGQAGTLLGGFAVITTLAIRPWHRRGLRVLRLWSASRSDERRFSAFEAATIVGIGAAIGAIIAVIATMIIARIADLDAATAIGRLADRGRALAVIAMLVGYWAIAVAILATAFERARLKRRVMVSDVIGLASVGIWALAATRGSSGASSLARGGDPLLAVTPALACIVAACVAIRIVPPSYSLIRRLLPQRWWAARLGMVDAVGRTPRALATGAFVAGAMTLATFALGYRSTLQAGSFDQAAYAVPLDFTLTEGQALIRPQSIRSASEWTDSGIVATDVLRRGLSVRRSGTAVDTVETIGLDPQVIPQIRGWRDDYGVRPDAALLRVATPPNSGVEIPIGTSDLSITTSPAPPNIAITAVMERADGTWHEANTTPTDATLTSWRTSLDPTDGDVRLHGFRIGESGWSTTQTLHNLGEGAGTDVNALAVTLSLSEVDTDGAPLAIDWSTLRSDGAVVTGTAGAADISFIVQASSSIFTFGDISTNATTPIPAIVDPLTASTARNGVVALEANGQAPVAVRVVGTLRAFPTAGKRFVVVDLGALSRTLDRIEPGSGTPFETWLAAPNEPRRIAVEAEVAGSRFAPIDSASRVGIQNELSGNTLGRAVIVAFLASSLVAALLGAVSLVFVTHADRLDELPVLRGLATDGADRKGLVTFLLIRAAALFGVAAPLGTGAGLVLLRAVRGLVNVSANGTEPVPALRTVVSPWVVMGCLAAVGGISLVGAWRVARSVHSIGRGDAMAATG